jgi:hypothetical protein
MIARRIFFRVKYLFASRGLKTLFFAPSVFHFFIGGTRAMRKDGDSTSVHFFVQNWRISTFGYVAPLKLWRLAPIFLFIYILILFKYRFAPCGLKTLFFGSSVFIFFIGGTCAMGKDGDGSSVQNWWIFTLATHGTIKIVTRGPHIYIYIDFFLKKYNKKFVGATPKGQSEEK